MNVEPVRGSSAPDEQKTLLELQNRELARIQRQSQEARLKKVAGPTAHVGVQPAPFRDVEIAFPKKQAVHSGTNVLDQSLEEQRNVSTATAISSPRESASNQNRSPKYRSPVWHAVRNDTAARARDWPATVIVDSGVGTSLLRLQLLQKYL